jgi:hypothetical protein
MRSVARLAVPLSVPLRDYLNKELPPLPDAIRKQNDRVDSTASRYLDRILLINSPHAYRESSDELLRSIVATRCQTSRSTSPPLLPPTVSQPWHKVSQLSGYEPKFDTALHPDQNFSTFVESSESSSVYSQAEGGPDAQEAGIENKRAAPPDTGNVYLKPSIYSIEGSSGKLSDDAVKDQSASSFSNSSSKGNQEGITQSLTRVSLDGPSLEKHLNAVRSPYQTRSTTDHELDLGGYNQAPNDATLELVPALPAFRAKLKKPEHLNLDKISLFEYARDSMARGSRGHSAPSKKVATTQTPSPLIPRHKENFSASKHSLKSPFPSPWGKKNSERTKDEDSPGGLFSGVMRRRGTESPPIKKTNIQKSAKALDSPDTPTPSKLGFVCLITLADVTETIQTGNEHLREAVSKAKHKLAIKTTSERRRDNRKKKIVVIGLTDQSPGIFLLNKTNVD